MHYLLSSDTISLIPQCLRRPCKHICMFIIQVAYLHSLCVWSIMSFHHLACISITAFSKLGNIFWKVLSFLCFGSSTKIYLGLSWAWNFLHGILNCTAMSLTHMLCIICKFCKAVVFSVCFRLIDHQKSSSGESIVSVAPSTMTSITRSKKHKGLGYVFGSDI